MICVEYLIIVEKSNTFCDSEATFNKLLQVDSTLIVSKGVIKHKGVFSYNYLIMSLAQLIAQAGKAY